MVLRKCYRPKLQKVPGSTPAWNYFFFCFDVCPLKCFPLHSREQTEPETSAKDGGGAERQRAPMRTVAGSRPSWVSEEGLKCERMRFPTVRNMAETQASLSEEGLKCIRTRFPTVCKMVETLAWGPETGLHKQKHQMRFPTKQSGDLWKLAVEGSGILQLHKRDSKGQLQRLWRIKWDQAQWNAKNEA